MVPFHVHPDALAAAVAGMKAMRNLGGLCVTVPHKIELAALCDDLGASGRRLGAVNAVRFDDVPDAGPGGAGRMEIGRAAGGERGWQCVLMSGGRGYQNNKTT